MRGSRGSFAREMGESLCNLFGYRLKPYVGALFDEGEFIGGVLEIADYTLEVSL